MAGHNSSAANAAGDAEQRFAVVSSENHAQVSIVEGSRLLWRGFASKLVMLPDFDSLYTANLRELLRQAARSERRQRSVERGRQRGCVSRLSAFGRAADERAYLGTPVYRVNYHDALGRSRHTPAFAIKARALEALALMRSKGFQAVIVA